MSMIERHPKRVYFLYGHKNPPTSVDAARERLDALELDIQQVKAQIEFADPNDFSVNDEFHEWKKRAMRAIASYSAEMSYLRSFVNGGEVNKRVSDADVKEVRKEIDKITKNVRKHYHEIIGDGLITDVIVADTQYASLDAFREDVGNMFVAIREGAKAKGIGKGRLSGYWRDMSDLYLEMNRHLGKLGRFLRENGVVEVKSLKKRSEFPAK